MDECKSCGDPKAKEGFTGVYCPNPDCSNFDQEQLDLVLAEAEETHKKKWEQLSFSSLLGEFYD